MTENRERFFSKRGSGLAVSLPLKESSTTTEDSLFVGAAFSSGLENLVSSPSSEEEERAQACLRLASRYQLPVDLLLERRAAEVAEHLYAVQLREHKTLSHKQALHRAALKFDALRSELLSEVGAFLGAEDFASLLRERGIELL